MSGHGATSASGYNAYSSYPGASHVPTCKYPGCSRPCYRESYGRVHDFCGRTHAQEYSRIYGGYGMGYSAQAQRKKTPSTTSATSGRQPVRAVHHDYHSLSTRLAPRDEIWFYNRDEPYYEFTNFYPCSVPIDGKIWPTTEHYFQAQKFVGTPYLDKIRRLPSPRDAFQLSRDPLVSRWRRGDWESVKDNIMLKALRIKFSDSLKLRDKLRSTGEKRLVEHTSNDSYWGDGGNGTGQNKLGWLLMQVRSELKEKYGPYIPPTSYFGARDDSSISHRPSSTSTSGLRRSSSFSNLSTCHTAHTPLSYGHSGGKKPHGTASGTYKQPPKSSSKKQCSESGVYGITGSHT
jgi:ribA/ribD-fused uncharacterized protein